MTNQVSRAKVEIWGHRGSRGTHVENTIPSFYEAVACGADFIEFDLQLSADKIPVVYHDPFISGRLCLFPDHGIVRHPLPIWQLRAKDIGSFIVGSYADPRYSGQLLVPGCKIPTLKELFAEVNSFSSTIGYNLEIKMPTGPGKVRLPIPGEFVSAVLKVVDEFDCHDRVVISSFHPQIVAEVKKQTKRVRISRLFSKNPLFLEEVLKSDLERITVHHEILDAEKLYQCHRKGIEVLTYTVNRKSNWQYFIDAGVSAIITDYPRKLYKYLNRDKDEKL